MARSRHLFKRSTGGALVVMAAFCCAPSPGRAQAPDEDWRTLETEHFRVTFPAELEAVGRRAAARAEVAYDLLSTALPEPGGSRIDLLVTDNSDQSNGFAQVRPSKRITVQAAPPIDGLQLSYYDDWLELVITHELAHVMHLDEAEMVFGRLGRALFGRASTDWPLFPGVATPDWVIEGLATWYESRFTSAGRVRGTFHEMEIRTAVLEGRFESIGQASGRSPLWPGGNRSYLYGSIFFDHLLERYGEDRMTAFVEAVAGQWVPYRIDAAARSAFGVSFSDAWSEWETELDRRYDHLDRDLAANGPITEPERLTHGARWALYVGVSPDGETLVYSMADGRSDTQLRRSRPDGTESREISRTNSVSTFGWMPDGRLLVSQLENADPYTAYGDLYVFELDGGSRRLSAGARLSQPSVAPDGSWAVAVRQAGGTNALTLVTLPDGELRTMVAPDPDVHWSFPAVSPDGRWIAAARWVTGGEQDIVLVDPLGERSPVQVTQDRAVDTAPSWSPDGRWLVWSSDRTGISNVLAAEVDQGSGTVGAPRLLSNVRTGAANPTVDPSGRWVYFGGYHVDGWDVERIPFSPDAARPAPPPAARFEAPEPYVDAGTASGAVEGFSPLPTLVPRYWEPRYTDPVVAPAAGSSSGTLRRRELLGFGLGAETGSVDLVGRHAYSAYVDVFTSGGKAAAGLSYTYRGLGNPVLSVDAAQSYRSAGRVLAGAAPDTFYVLDRERSVAAAVTVLSTRWRRDLAVSLGGGLAWTRHEQLDNDLRTVPLDASVPTAPRFGDVSLGLSYSTARTHSFQTGATEGFNLYAYGRRRIHLNVASGGNGVPGSDLSVDELFGRLRGYVPLWQIGYARHVLALQVATGAAYGPNASFGRFGVGGASGTPEPLTGFTVFGGNAVPLPIRGYEVASRFGRWAWAASAEYRFPLALVNRGLGAWPLHFDRLVGSVFFDAGNAWEPGPRLDPLTSVGAELSVQLLGRYDVPLLLRTGLAVPFARDVDPSVYVRVGLPF
ncbi:MAG: hypothetical protein PVI31_03645 [Gemmatimonadota bacterium]